jgi:hypothetical protein
MSLNGFAQTRQPLVGLAATGVAVAVIGLLAVGGARGARSTSTLLATFNVAGTYSWTVPVGITKISFDVFGASGGNVADGQILINKGGPGGEAKGHFTVKPGETFEIVVGGRGGDNSGKTGGAGGFNGGGQGANGLDVEFGGGGGGGGSDVRIGGIGNVCVSNSTCGFADRIIAGGGGGGGFGEAGVNGGAGGGLVGGDSGDGPGTGGTQEQGGHDSNRLFCHFCDGSFGRGGTPATDGDPGDGGGGGGWYGGSGGQAGAGGSGFVSPLARSGSFPGGTHGGDGLITIRTP